MSETYEVTGWGPTTESRSAYHDIVEDELSSVIVSLFDDGGCRRVTVTKTDSNEES